MGASRSHHRRPRRIDARATLVGLTCLGTGGLLAYLAFATPFLDRVMPSARLETTQSVTGMVVWAVALTAPAGLAILGLVRLGDTFESLFATTPPGPVRSLTGRLAQGTDVFGPVRLPDGRLIPELVIGPFGVAIFEVLPPRAASRHQGHTWEVRLPDGRWIPIENPLDQATRDAERVRRWLATDDRDFVVKVHAAVIAADNSLPRTPTCAVLTRDEVPSWLASLPGQRTLTEGRRSLLTDLIVGAS